MSFGYSLGDFITVGQLAWNVYKSCKEAPDSFADISSEVLSLHVVLKEVEEILSEELASDQNLPALKLDSLVTITEGCQDVLRDLEAVAKKYESLSSRSKWTWDRMRWSSGDIAELRQRLTSNIVMLNAFLNTSQMTVQRRLRNYMRERQDGKHEGSIISVATLESLTPDDKLMWHEIRKELENIGISVAAFDANKNFILEWFQKALEDGAFEELEQNHSRPSSQCSEELYIYIEHVAQEQGILDSNITSEEFSHPNAKVLDGEDGMRLKYERFVRPRGAAEGTIVEVPSVSLNSTVNLNSSTTSAVNEKEDSKEQEAFAHLPAGHHPDNACYYVSSSEIQLLRKQAWDQASRFEVLFSTDVNTLSRELKALDERCKYLRKTYRSLRSGRRNLHTRIVSYLRSPETERFSHQSMLKQEEALAELDSSIDDWVSKLEFAENRRTRVRQKLLEHVAATLIIPPLPTPPLEKTKPTPL